MNGWAVITTVIRLYKIKLFKLVNKIHASDEEIVVLLRKIKFVVSRSKNYISEDHLWDCEVAAANYTSYIEVDFVFEVYVEGK